MPDDLRAEKGAPPAATTDIYDVADRCRCNLMRLRGITDLTSRAAAPDGRNLGPFRVSIQERYAGRRRDLDPFRVSVQELHARRGTRLRASRQKGRAMRHSLREQQASRKHGHSRRYPGLRPLDRMLKIESEHYVETSLTNGRDGH